MMITYADRACGILYHFIKSRPKGYYLLPANVCPVVPFTILKAGSYCDFVDISPVDYCIDQFECLNRIKQNKGKYVGVIFVHTYGLVFSVSNFAREVKLLNPRIAFIEDCCLSIPDILSFSLPQNVDLVLYSTGYAKYVELGYGGFGINNGGSFAIAHDLLFDEKDLIALETGYKQAFSNNTIYTNYSSLNWLNTRIITNEKIISEYVEQFQSKRAEITKQKNKINNLYTSLLPSNVLLGEKYNDWRFNICVSNPDIILKKIFSEGLFASRHYQPSAYLFNNEEIYINSDKLYSSVINLFNDFHITLLQAEQICKIINSLL